MIQDNTADPDVNERALMDFLDALAEAILQEFPQRDEREQFRRVLARRIQCKANTQAIYKQHGMTPILSLYEYLTDRIYE